MVRICNFISLYNLNNFFGGHINWTNSAKIISFRLAQCREITCKLLQFNDLDGGKIVWG